MAALIDMIEGTQGRAPPAVAARRRRARTAGASPPTSSRPATGRLLGLWGDTGCRAHGGARRARRRDRRRHPRMPGRNAFPRSARCIRRRSASSARSAISSGSSRSACRTRGPGSISASGTSSIRSATRAAAPAARAPYAFLPVEGESLHQIPVGPVHAGIIEPGHFRFTANGETVVRLEERLGYVHKGIEALMAGAIARAGGAARRPHLGRQHGRLCARLRARGRGGARHRRSPPRARLSARADGRARAARQSFRRHRRDLQRRLVLAHARALRHPARARRCAPRMPASATA